jgi:hypothetical protein
LSIALGSSGLAGDSGARPVPRIEGVLGAAAGTDRLHDALDVPVAVAGFDVDAAAAVVRGEEHRRLPAATLPAEQDVPRRIQIAKPRGIPLLGHCLLPPAG